MMMARSIGELIRAAHRAMITSLSLHHLRAFAPALAAWVLPAGSAVTLIIVFATRCSQPAPVTFAVSAHVPLVEGAVSVADARPAAPALVLTVVPLVQKLTMQRAWTPVALTVKRVPAILAPADALTTGFAPRIAATDFTVTPTDSANVEPSGV